MRAGEVLRACWSAKVRRRRDLDAGVAAAGLGADFAFGHFTHSFRGSYEKFHNLISDETAGNSSLYNPIPSLAFYYSAQHLYAGPNYLAPQGTFQSPKSRVSRSVASCSAASFASREMRVAI